MKKLILITYICFALISCKKPSDDPMPSTSQAQPTLYFLEYEVPSNTTVTSVFDGDTIIDTPINGISKSFATIDKTRVISYKSSNPINIIVRERIINNYNGAVYLTITNTTSGTLDFSSLPK